MRSSIPSLLCAGLLISPPALGENPELKNAAAALADHLPEVAVKSLESILADPEADPEDKTIARERLLEARVRAGQFQQAVAMADDLPGNAGTRFWLGHAHAALGETDAALRLWSEVAKGELAGPALQNRLELLVLSGRGEDADSLLESLADNKDGLSDAIPRILRARIALENNQPEKALELLGDGADESPGAKLLVARAMIALGKSDEALETIERQLAEKLSPPRHDALRILKAEALAALERPSEAATFLVKSLGTPHGPDYFPAARGKLDELVKAGHLEAVHDALRPLMQTNAESDENTPLTADELSALLFLAGISEPDEAFQVLDAILESEPDRELANLARLEKSRLLMENNSVDEATRLLKEIEASGADSALPPMATELLARLAFAGGDFATAKELFARAGTTGDAAFAEASLMNQALSAIAADSPLPSLEGHPDLMVAIQLDRALAASDRDPGNAEPLLKAFLTEHPGHPRAAEAELALVSLLFLVEQPDLPQIRKRLDQVAGTALSEQNSRRLFALERHYAAISGDWQTAVQAAVRHRSEFPESDTDTAFLLQVAEAYFYKRDFNKAAQLLEKAAGQVGPGPLRDMALIYYAKAELEIPTEQATDSALRVLEEMIAEGGPRAVHARILKASTLLNKRGQAEKALATLGNLATQTGESIDAALLAAEAHRELGATDSRHYAEAISTYEKLLADPHTSYTDSNRIHFRLARTYRESGNLPEALDACYRVINFENHPAGETLPAWTYYYRCGFEAIDILEEAKRFRAALSLAHKLAATEGPGAAEAAERARQLELEHMLWQD